MSSDLIKYLRSLSPKLAHSIQFDKYATARKAKRAKYKRNRKLLRKHVWYGDDRILNLKEIMNSDNKIFLGVSDTEDLISAEIMKIRSDNNKTTVQRETTVLCNRSGWANWAENYYKDYLYLQHNSSSGMIIDKTDNNFIKFDVNNNSTTIRAYGDVNFCESQIDAILNTFDVVSSYVEWVYGSDGQSVNVPLNRDRLPVEEMYPFLKGESLGSYYDRYMASSANILLLIGPPGTGKTTFIRGLLAHRDCSAIVTYDAGILEKDAFFAKFIEDDSDVMVLEDSDAFLKSRSDGNTMMHRFLNVGDGLVTTKGKKMIFSTNLPSIRDIDSALIRPGRCFDIIEFKPLSLFDATKLAEKLDAKLPVRNGGESIEYSIAEVFNQQSEQSKKTQANRKVGFI